jgi:hypothetical protein
MPLDHTHAAFKPAGFDSIRKHQQIKSRHNIVNTTFRVQNPVEKEHRAQVNAAANRNGPHSSELRIADMSSAAILVSRRPRQ